MPNTAKITPQTTDNNLPPSAEILLQKITDKTARIAILGMGYVGFPLALATHAKGYGVIAYDIDEAKITALNAGKSYLKGIEDAEIQALNKQGNFEATNCAEKLAEADILLICVPTPLTRYREPEMAYVEATAHSIAQHGRAGQLIVLESTTYPGTTRELLKPILESGELKVGSDIFLAYSPEREDPGNGFYSTHSIPKVVGADDAPARSLVQAFYEQIITQVVCVSNSMTAEAVKLTENIFRSVNIALVNELKMVFDKMDIDIWEVIDAAKSKPFGFMPFYPGPGVGGHCIPIDPFYLTWKSREYGMPTRFIELAGQINERMQSYVIDRLREALDMHAHKGLHGSRILMMGLSYKKNVEDVRESPALFIFERLENFGAQVDYYDPHVASIPPTREHPSLVGKQSINLSAKNLASYDAVLITTNHDAVDYDMLGEHAALIIDTRNAMQNIVARAKIVKA
jgi:UDP-N-acetyl-D-glucosamine dehydrogenase